MTRAKAGTTNPAHITHSVGRKGHCAMQLHTGDALKIRFKEIQIREFTSSGKSE